MRCFFLISFLLGFSFAAQAVEAPAGQTPVGPHDVLRGQFAQEHQMKGTPIQSTGHFTLAPDHGLLWNIEQPFPTTTIITPRGSVQDIGGIVLKLPIKNLQHLYSMIGGALTGNWDGLAHDFTIEHSGNAEHWQMLLTPRTDAGHSTSSYSTITVSGGHFVENISMTKTNGDYDKFNFTGEKLSSAPLSGTEVSTFAKAE